MEKNTVEEPKKFYQLFKAGLVNKDAADDYIEAWHKGSSEETMQEFLGMAEMSEEDYSNFIVRGILK